MFSMDYHIVACRRWGQSRVLTCGENRNRYLSSYRCLSSFCRFAEIWPGDVLGRLATALVHGNKIVFFTWMLLLTASTQERKKSLPQADICNVA